MEYITAEQFLEQSKEVQKVFLDRWTPSIGDLYCNVYNNQQDNVLVINNCQIELFKSFAKDIKQYGCPLLIIGQLIKFIEDKKYKIEINNFKIKKWNVAIYKELTQCELTYEVTEESLLQALWQIALIVAKDEVKING